MARNKAGPPLRRCAPNAAVWRRALRRLLAFAVVSILGLLIARVLPHVGKIDDPLAALRGEPVMLEVPSLNASRAYYRHGGFIGAVPLFAADGAWRSILAHLMPDVYADVARDRLDALARKSNVLENNPVLAAFGMLVSMHGPTAEQVKLIRRRRGDESETYGWLPRDAPPVIEWDVFLPSGYISRLRDRAAQPEEPHFESASTESAGGSAELADRDDVGDVVVAHGSALDLALDMGLQRDRSEAVSARRYTRSGGPRLYDWLSLFGSAIEAGLCCTPAYSPDHCLPPRGPPDIAGDFGAGYDGRSSSGCSGCLPPLRRGDRAAAAAKGLATFEALTGGQPLRVFLDIKSGDVDPEVLAGFVVDLNRLGVAVDGVASFLLPKVDGVADLVGRQAVSVGSFVGSFRGSGRVVDLDPPREVLLFHYARDVVHAVQDGRVPRGASVLFNGGSLILYPRLAAVRGLAPVHTGYRLHTEMIDALAAAVAAFDLDIGYYVQEFDLDAHAHTLLVRLANGDALSAAPVFRLGFAWGGIGGLTPAHIAPTLVDATVGTGVQGLGSSYNVFRSLDVEADDRGAGDIDDAVARH